MPSKERENLNLVRASVAQNLAMVDSDNSDTLNTTDELLDMTLRLCAQHRFLEGVEDAMDIVETRTRCEELLAHHNGAVKEKDFSYWFIEDYIRTQCSIEG